jgi:large subunit ribosomal protein L25
MAEIVLNVELRERTGTGGARAARRDDKVPGVLYGGPRGPVALEVASNEFRKALYTGKLLGHLVTLKYGKESQPVIAKDVQFHPVTDEPIHFDLYRVEEHQEIRISVPVHVRGQDDSPGLKRGGALNIVTHDLEVRAAADSIPEEIAVDVSGLEIGQSVHLSELTLPEGVRAVATDGSLVIVAITGVSSVETAEEGEAAAAAEGEAEATEE